MFRQQNPRTRSLALSPRHTQGDALAGIPDEFMCLPWPHGKLQEIRDTNIAIELLR